MTEHEDLIDWSKTTFEGSRREQLRRALQMSVRERLEALNQLAALSERLRTMPKCASDDTALSSASDRSETARSRE